MQQLEPIGDPAADFKELPPGMQEYFRMTETRASIDICKACGASPKGTIPVHKFGEQAELGRIAQCNECGNFHIVLYDKGDARVLTLEDEEKLEPSVRSVIAALRSRRHVYLHSGTGVMVEPVLRQDDSVVFHYDARTYERARELAKSIVTRLTGSTQEEGQWEPDKVAFADRRNSGTPKPTELLFVEVKKDGRGEAGTGNS